MIIGRDLRYVFMSTPKAATNSLYAWLTEHYGGVHDKTQVFHGTQVPDDCLDFFKWTVVRNPYSRAVSIWWQLTQNPERDSRWENMVEPLDFVPFWEWVLTHHHGRDGAVCWTQVEFHGEYNVGPDRIISTERLQIELTELPFIHPLDGIASTETFTIRDRWPLLSLVPRLNESRSKRKPWGDYYTPEALSLVNHWGKVDAEAFRYAQVQTVEELTDYDPARLQM